MHLPLFLMKLMLAPFGVSYSGGTTGFMQAPRGQDGRARTFLFIP